MNLYEGGVMKKIAILIWALGILFSPALSQAEEYDEAGILIATSPLGWGIETAQYPFRIVGSFLGTEGDPQDNMNWGGYGEKYGYYESISNESEYRYLRWGVN